MPRVLSDKKTCAVVIAAVTLNMSAVAADSETSAQSPEGVEEVVVTGIRSSLKRAMDVKRSASGVVDAIAAEDIGKFPDQNLAESLQRIPGVSIDRQGGEGALVTVRGFGPEFNTVLVNGRQMPTDNPGREFSFDTLAAELINGVDVYKTANSSLQSGGIGSTINIRTARPLALNDMTLAGSAKGYYNVNSGETSPQVSGLISRSFADRTFGALLAFSHQRTQGRSDEAQIDGWVVNSAIPDSQLLTPTTTNTFAPQNYDQRVLFDERTRTGGSVVLQYEVSDRFELVADALLSKFVVDTSATSIGHWFDSGNMRNVRTDANGTVLSFDQNTGLATDFHARKWDRESTLRSFGLEAKWQVSDSLGLKFDVATSEAKLIDNNGNSARNAVVGYFNEVTFDNSRGNTLPGLSRFESSRTVFNPLTGAFETPGNYLDPANPSTAVMLRGGWDVVDELDQFKIDGAWDADAGVLKRVKFGLLLSDQSKGMVRKHNDDEGRNSGGFVNYTNNPNLPDDFFSVFHAGSDFLDGLSGSNTIPTSWLRFDGDAMFEYQTGVARERDPNFTFEARENGGRFVVSEEIWAAYSSLEFETALASLPLAINVGLRYEVTDTKVVGTSSLLTGLTHLDLTQFVGSYGEPTPISGSTDYSDFLPSIDFKLDINDEMVLRFALSRTLTRPTLSQMAPSIDIGTIRPDGNLQASSGNAALEPFKSTNLDLSYEWYYAPNSYVAAGYFRKDVDDFITTRVVPLTFAGVTDPSTGSDRNATDPDDQIAVFNLAQPSNGETATADGFEFAVQHTFGDSGFGVMANLTLVDSNAQLDRNNVEQSFALTGLSDSQNLVAFYEKAGLQVRLAWNNRDGFLQKFGQPIGNAEPVFVEDYQQFDISASYDLTDQLTVFVEGTNITEEETLRHGRYANQLLDAIDPGARYALGARYKFNK